MLAGLKVLPLVLDMGVGLELDIGLRKLISVFVISRGQVGEDKGGGSLALILGFDRYKHQVDNVILTVKSLEDVGPTKREEFSL